MSTSKTLFAKFFLAAAVIGAAMLPASAQQNFKTPEEAVQALTEAARSQDRAKVLAILGPGGRDIISSGDEVADRNARQLFLLAYDRKQSLQKVDDKTAILMVGEGEWPFPIPVVRAGQGWRFDTNIGRQELLYRRIGRNELNAIDVCFGYVEAQNDYAEFATKEFGKPEFAQRVISSPGKKDGLYWPADGKTESPLGDFIALATAEGYGPGQVRIPYHGYYYKILTQQGSQAPGGAKQYLVRGKMTEGFALVAWPAEYANSGVKTFVVNQLGVVFEKDLGPGTAHVASQMTVFNPDQTWKRYAEEN